MGTKLDLDIGESLRVRRLDSGPHLQPLGTHQAASLYDNIILRVATRHVAPEYIGWANYTYQYNPIYTDVHMCKEQVNSGLHINVYAHRTSI